ncbi:MAG: hypothetical protein AAFY71_19775 [Bacteroidota bacterium]
MKRIYVYKNTKKDLSEIVDFDEKGRRSRSIKYRGSSNRLSRKRKDYVRINLYSYDSFDRITKIADSLGSDYTSFIYGKKGKLISSFEKFDNAIFETVYYYNPYRSVRRKMLNGKLLEELTEEYDKNFYVSRFYKVEFKPKMKKITDSINGRINTTAYRDYNDWERQDGEKTFDNEFDSSGRLVSSWTKSVFLEGRVFETYLQYKYYKNGLLKRVVGYVPIFYKYEFYE